MVLNNTVIFYFSKIMKIWRKNKKQTYLPKINRRYKKLVFSGLDICRYWILVDIEEI
jgi:hypothetical protein